MSENTAYEFKLKLFNIEVFNLSISSTAASSKTIAAGTVFTVGLIAVLGAYADKLYTVFQYLTK